MNIIAIDFGTKRLGIAVGDTEMGIAFPRDGMENTDNKKSPPNPLFTKEGELPPLEKERAGEGFLDSFSQILTLCQQEKTEKVLVGLPLMPRGTDSKETENARRFAEDLEDYLLHHDCDIPVDFTDERFSSKSAQQAAKKNGLSQKQSRGNIDSAAAAIFLQQYLDGC